jgi:hypothetical protein
MSSARSRCISPLAAGALFAVALVLLALERGRHARAERDLHEIRGRVARIFGRTRHALRTPLTPLLARAEILRAKVQDRPDELRQVEAILRAAAKLEQAIESLSEDEARRADRSGRDNAVDRSGQENRPE